MGWGGLMLRVFTIIGLMFFASAALAADCDSVVPGATLGVPPDVRNPDDPAFQGSCWINFGSGGGEIREGYEQKCKGLPGYVLFYGDYGSNRNLCVFRPQESVQPVSPPPAEPAPVPDEPVVAPPPPPPEPSEPEPAVDNDPHEGDRYSALVWTPDGAWFGKSANKLTPQAAIDEARELCAAMVRHSITTLSGTGPACSKQVWVKNGCISMARTDRWAIGKGWAVEARDDKKASDGAALGQCQSDTGNACEIIEAANTCSRADVPILLPPPQPQQPPPPRPMTEDQPLGKGNSKFRVCNQENQNVSVSVVLRENGVWFVRGWFIVSARACRDMMLDAGTIYWHVRLSPTEHWGGTDFRQCVPLDRFARPVRGGQCSDGETLADFKKQQLSPQVASELRLSR